MAQPYDFFRMVLSRRGYFMYIPDTACDDLRTGEANAVEFKLNRSGTARNSWKDHPLLPEIERIERGEIPLFRVNTFDISDWNQLERAFQLNRGWGYIDLHDGSVAEVVVAEIEIGRKEKNEWVLQMDGWIVALKQRFPPDRIARIAHLVEERLHQARRVEPSQIIRVADFLELVAAN